MKVVAWILLFVVVVLPALLGFYEGWIENREKSDLHMLDSHPICQKQALGVSICALAQGQAQNLAKHLPYKVDENSTITSVASNLNVLNVTAITEFSEEALKRELGNDLPAAINTFTISQIETATKSLCHGDKRNRAFIQAGGVVEYQMQYKNTQALTTYRVESCPAI